MIRSIKLLTDAQISLLTERRSTSPYGLAGGEPGAKGENKLIHGSVEITLPSKGSLYASSGDELIISTPGGGGFGTIDGRK
jgi:N-methylhydantoinase B